MIIIIYIYIFMQLYYVYAINITMVYDIVSYLFEDNNKMIVATLI